MTDPFAFADDLGPAKVVHIYRPGLDLRAILVIDNVAIGPSIGGVRMAPDVSLEEAFRLARAMTLKNAAAGLPHGGGKSVIFGDPGMDPVRKEALVRAFARSIRELTDYIPGPDMGTDEAAMAWVRDEIGRSVGLPAALGGIPLDEIGATGFGLAAAVDVAATHIGLELDGARVAIQGFGAVGRHAAAFLAERGARLVAASDSHGTVSDEGGLDIAGLTALKAAGRAVTELPGARTGDRDAILDAPCDIWVPAARPDVLTETTVRRLKTRIVAQGANIPATPEAEAWLRAQGVLVLPDFIANAGGVICAAVEYRGGTKAQAFATIDEKLRTNTAAVLDAARTKGVAPRAAALDIAAARVREAMGYGRWR